MTTTTLPLTAASPAPMTIFERYLTVWVFLCIVVGIALGQLLPGPFQAIGRMEIAKVNLPVGLLIWVMIIPMLLKVDFGALSEVRKHWRGIGVTLFVNWAVKPFSIAHFSDRGRLFQSDRGRRFNAIVDARRYAQARGLM